MRNRIPLVPLLCALVAAWAGCASPRPAYYTLGPVERPAAPSAGYSVAVGPVSVPEVVDRSQIVVRTGPHQVAPDEFNRWGSPLPRAIAQAVAGNLSAMLGTPYVSLYPKQIPSGAGYRVVIDVMAFETAPGDSASLDALWVVRSLKDGTVRRGRTAARETVPEQGYPAIVAAHSRALAKMSADIAAAIRELESGGK